MKKIVALILVTAIAAMGMVYFKKQSEVSRVVEIQTVKPEISDLYDYITVRGKVSEKIRYNVYSGVSGFVSEVYVSTGDYIENGQELMKIIPIEGEDSKDNLYNEVLSVVTGMLDELINGTSVECTAEAVSFVSTVEDGSCVVLSPCSGTVMSVDCAVNENIISQYPCMVVSDLSQLEIKAEIEEQYLTQITKDMRCTAVVSALSEKLFTCKISEIEPYGTNSLSLSGNAGVMTGVNLSIEDVDLDFLKPGYTAKVNIITSKKEQAVLIPYEAIGQDEDNNLYVYIVSDGKLNKTNIKTGKELDYKTEVTEGLEGDELLVINPEEIKAGDTVIIR